MDQLEYLEGCLINAFYVNTEIQDDLFNSHTFDLNTLLKELRSLGYWLFEDSTYKGAVLLYIKGEWVFPVNQEDRDQSVFYFDKDGWSKDSVHGYVSYGKKEIHKES